MPINVPIPFMTLVEDEIRENRYSTCKGCDQFTIVKTCNQCGCVMPVKVVWADSECPLGKWLKVTE